MKAQEYLSEGNALLQKGDPEQAAIQFGKVVELLPDLAVGYINRALAYSALSKYTEALADADKALSLVQPDSYAARFTSLANQVKAKVHQAQGDHKAALAFYTTAIEIDSSNPVFFNGRGVSHLMLSQHDQAIKDFSKTIELNPRLSQPYVNRAVAYRALKNCDAAIRDTTEAIKLSSSDVVPYINRANCYLDLKKYDEAIEDLTKAISIEPKADLFYNRARVRLDQGDYEKSIADNTEAISRDAKHDKAYFNRGISYQRIRKYGLAVDDLRKALSLNEVSPSRRYNLAFVLYQSGQFSETIKEAGKLISTFPKWRAPVALRANAYARIGDSLKLKSDTALANKLDATWKPEEEGFFIFDTEYLFTTETK
jgi:tetratricopeptide (TPR) repeat protein